MIATRTLRSAIHDLEEFFDPYLAPYDRELELRDLKSRRKREYINTTKETAIATANLIRGFGNVVGALASTDAVSDGLRAARGLSEQIDDLVRSKMSVGTADAGSRRDIVDRYIEKLALVMETPPSAMAALPAIIVIDDAQWIHRDATLPSFAERLMREASAKQWPLLVIVTSWEREWKSGDAPSPRMAFADKGLNEESIVVHSSGGLDALVRAAFPALPDAQVAAILQKADGNAKALPTRQKHCYE